MRRWFINLSQKQRTVIYLGAPLITTLVLFPYVPYGGRRGFLPLWSGYAVWQYGFGRTTLLLIAIVATTCVVTISYFGGPSTSGADSPGANRITMIAGLVYLAMGLILNLVGAGMYGAAPRVLVFLLLGPFVLIPARILIRDVRLRGVVIVIAGCISSFVLARYFVPDYGVSLTFWWIVYLDVPMIAVGMLNMHLGC